MTDRPVFTREKAKRIDAAARRIHNHREHVREEKQLPEYRRDHIPTGALERIELGTRHDVTVSLRATDDKLEVKVEVETLARNRRRDRLADISLFFSSLVDAIGRSVARHIDGTGRHVDPMLSFQGDETDAFYRCRQSITGV